MWFEDQVLFPRIVKSFLWTLVIQESYLSLAFLVFKFISWNPIAGFIDWLLYLVHWKTLVYRSVLCLTTVAFAILNRRFYNVEKHICSTRFKKICRTFSLLRVQHFLLTAVLGGLASHCYIKLFQLFDPQKKSFFSSFLCLEEEFEHLFVVQHGCYTSFMFSLKYFICFLYLVKLTLNQESKKQHIKHQISELAKDSVLCVLKAIHWSYLFFILIAPLLVDNLSMLLGIKISTSETFMAFLYSMINLRLFLVSFVTGVMIFFNWSLYLVVFNTFAAERHIFPLEVPDKSKTLAVALVSSQSDILKYLAVLDLRLLAQNNPQRRKEVFAISHPGGHPHQWKALSEFCISALKKLVHQLHEYSVITAVKDTKSIFNKVPLAMNEQKRLMTEPCDTLPSLSEKTYACLREWPVVAYFLDDLPSTKIRQLFASSQPLIWMSEALGFLVAASYSEDQFGVVQQTLPEIIQLLLDLKMAEEKLPIDLVGIKTHVKDPHGRYEHIHQRVALKTSVNAALCRIADTFKNDINGIYLPEEYHRYFQRYLNRKNS